MLVCIHGLRSPAQEKQWYEHVLTQSYHIHIYILVLVPIRTVRTRTKYIYIYISPLLPLLPLPLPLPYLFSSIREDLLGFRFDLI